jgi:hypothetical protein
MIDAATVREQFQRFSRQWDDHSLLTDYADLLRRYLSQPLSDSETAWAYQTLANVLACSEHAAEAVDVHEAFERWLPGNSPRLSVKFPRYPAPEGSREPAMGPDEIRLEWRCLPHMHAIADEEPDADSVARLHGRILTWEIQLARARNDAARITAKFQEALSLLDRLEKKGSSARALGVFRHNLAHHLNQSGRYDLALPVLDAKLAAEGGSHRDHGYAWLMHAAAVWKVTRDRPRTLALLREARDHDPRDLTNEFQTSAFEDVQDDPEFLQAISRSGTCSGGASSARCSCSARPTKV